MAGQEQQMKGLGQQTAGQGQQTAGQGLQQQQQIIVMQAEGPANRRFAPHLTRGTDFLGCHMPGLAIKIMTVVGMVGTVLLGVNWGKFNIILTILGMGVTVTLLFLSCYLTRKAKSDWDALPLDHPDRIKIAGIAAIPVPQQQQSGGYNQAPGNYLQPSPGSYNQPSTGPYNPIPFDCNQPPPGPYKQPLP